MDPVTIAAGAVALLTPYLTRAASDFAGEAGAAAWRAAARLFNRIKEAVVGYPEERAVVESFEAQPEEAAASVRQTLISLLERDSGLATEIAALLEEVKRHGPALIVAQRINEAERIVGADIGEFRRGSVDVDQEIKNSKDITGARIDKLG